VQDLARQKDEALGSESNVLFCHARKTRLRLSQAGISLFAAVSRDYSTNTEVWTGPMPPGREV